MSYDGGKISKVEADVTILESLEESENQQAFTQAFGVIFINAVCDYDSSILFVSFLTYTTDHRCGKA